MTPSDQITAYITGITDWRGEMLARLRELTLQAAPGLTEEWKWNSPIWSRNGMVCSISAFKAHVGINFFQGMSLADPNGLFGPKTDAKAMRSIKLTKGDTLHEAAYQDLVRAAVAFNQAR